MPLCRLVSQGAKMSGLFLSINASRSVITSTSYIGVVDSKVAVI